MKELPRAEAKVGAGNRRYELTPNDELFLINALKIAAGVYSERMSVALTDEGKTVDDRDVEVLRRLEQEYGSRAGYMGMSLEASEYEQLNRIVHGRVRGLVDSGDHFAGPVHYDETVSV